MEGKEPCMTKKELYDMQITMLKLFLNKGAITKEQYQKSVNDLTVKMGFDK